MFTPEYGETHLDFDDLEALTPDVRASMQRPVTKAAVFDVKQEVQLRVGSKFTIAALAGELVVGELLTDHFLRRLHRELYGPIWTWADKFRHREANIGVAPEHIASDLRQSFESIRHRWEHTDDWTPHDLGLVAHADAVRIHPFTDGNGRSTRLLADLVFIAAQPPDSAVVEDWRLDKRRYVEVLRRSDVDRDPGPLSAFVRDRPIE